MTAEKLKQSVIQSYGQLARSKKKNLFSKLFGCCDAPSLTNTIGEHIGYSQAELESDKDDANLGVGCGNPAAFSKIQEGETVVDLGSGAGFDAFIVAPIVGDIGKVIGVDLSDDMLDLARKNVQKRGFSQVEFLKGDIEDLPLDTNIADHVISNCVINLSLNKQAVFHEAFRVLKPGGKLSISDIVLVKELPGFIKQSVAAFVGCVAGAEPLNTYLNYIRAAGFEDVRIEKTTKFPLELMLMDPQLKKLADTLDIDINSEKGKELASYVMSVSVSAKK